MLIKSIRCLIYSVMLTSLLVTAIVLFWRPGTIWKQQNLGHRLGGDLFAGVSGVSENTLGSLRKAVAEFESREEYLYTECDLRETKDHEIVVFHDWDLQRLVPDNSVNRRALSTRHVGDQPIGELTFEQIKSLRLADGQEIPSLEEVLQCAVDWKLRKPLILEIKLLRTERGRDKVLQLAEHYRALAPFEIHFSAFRRNVSRSFDRPSESLRRFQDRGFRVYQVYRPKRREYDLCETW